MPLIDVLLGVRLADFLPLRRRWLFWNRVFDRFWRADPSRSRIRGGTGLGLSIAREDANLHGGEIRVWGELGKGANFVLTLPKRVGGRVETPPLSELPTDQSADEIEK